MPNATRPRSNTNTTDQHGHPSAADFYADPVVYDILHASGTADEVNALETVARRFALSAMRRGATWLEPACGTARHLRLLKKRGKRVVGFDVEPAMIGYAKRSLARSAFEARLDDFLDVRPSLRGRVALAFNLINTIRHADSDAEMLTHFDMIARALRPGGVYVVGLSLSLYGCESPTEDVWTGARGTTKVTQVVQYLPPAPGGKRDRDEQVISHLTIRTGRRTRDVDSHYVLRTYSLEQWHRLLARSALHIVGVVDQDGDEMDESPLGYAVYVLAPRSKPKQ